eukprot:TRINITY_DN20883_c0_g1_i1.p1 TRINITY_DN20883_c0_g1~~TRINITY_DN20883_c0_g1_i1.p1  ORF type:complete len:214 (+),score=21.36 TRINITY_DN20883_c0_g1_i1:103-744(+)
MCIRDSPKNVRAFESEKVIYCELCKLLTSASGPFSYKFLGWLYWKMQELMNTHKDKLGASIHIALSCSELFASNLYGVRILKSNFNEYLRGVVTTIDPAKLTVEAVHSVFKVISQLLSSCGSFTGITALKDDTAGMSLHLKDCAQVQDELSFLLDWRIQEKKLPQHYLNSFLWVSSLNVLQNKTGAECLNLSLIHICRCRRLLTCRSRWSPYH